MRHFDEVTKERLTSIFGMFHIKRRDSGAGYEIKIDASQPTKKQNAFEDAAKKEPKDVKPWASRKLEDDGGVLPVIGDNI